MSQSLTLFASHEDVRAMYSWRWEEIRSFLIKVSSAPEKYTRVAPTDLKRACRLIIEYNYARQHRYFTRRSADNPEKQELIPHEWKWHNKTVPFVTVFGVLGYIVSAIGLPFPGADAGNFYLPLLAVYARWCMILSESSTDLVPNKVFITWLSSSAGGPRELVITNIDTTDAAIGSGLSLPLTLKDQAQSLLRLWMNDTLGIALPSETSEMRKTPGSSGSLFGHCAESIPLALKASSIRREQRQDLWGICLDTHKIRLAAKESPYSTTELIKCISDPCLNCQFIMNMMHLNRKNFMKHYITIRIDPRQAQLKKKAKKALEKAASQDPPRDRSKTFERPMVQLPHRDRPRVLENTAGQGQSRERSKPRSSR